MQTVMTSDESQIQIFANWPMSQFHLRSFSAFSRVILGGKCAQAGIERDRSCLVEIPFHSIYENFGNSNQNFWSNVTRPLYLTLFTFAVDFHAFAEELCCRGLDRGTNPEVLRESTRRLSL